MKTIAQYSTLLVAFIMFMHCCGAFAQTNDQAVQPAQPAQPVSPRDRIAPAAKPGGNQPVTVRIAGANLRDDAGGAVGRVEDLIIDPQTGQIEFIIVSAFYPTNTIRLFPIPWKAITYRSGDSGMGMGRVAGANQVFALNYPRTKLKDAPTFERHRWPDMSEAAWRQPIYKHYGVSASGGAGSDTQSASGSGAGNDLADPNFIGPRLPDSVRLSSEKN